MFALVGQLFLDQTASKLVISLSCCAPRGYRLQQAMKKAQLTVCCVFSWHSFGARGTAGHACKAVAGGVEKLTAGVSPAEVMKCSREVRGGFRGGLSWDIGFLHCCSAFGNSELHVAAKTKALRWSMCATPLECRKHSEEIMSHFIPVNLIQTCPGLSFLDL